MLMLFIAGSLVFASAPTVVVSAQKMMPGREAMASALQIGFAWGSAGIMMGLVGHAGEIFGVKEVLYIAAGMPLLVGLFGFFLRDHRYQFEA